MIKGGMALMSAGLAMASGVAWAGTVERDVPLSGASKVTVINIAGETVVETWDEAHVWYHAELGEGCTGVDAEFSEGVLRVEVRVKSPNAKDKDAELRVKIPQGVDVAIESVSAEVNVTRPSGALEVQSSSGDIDCDFAGPRVLLSSVSGEVRAFCDAGQMDVRTASGDVSGRYNGASLRIETVSGEITIEGEQERATLSSTSSEITHNGVVGEVRAESVSGDIRLTKATRSAELFTTSGEVRIAGVGMVMLRAESISGDVHFEGTLSDDCVLDVASKSGDVVLSLPEATPARFDLRSFSGDIGGDLAGGAGSRGGPGKTLEFSREGGTARVSAKSFSGDIHVVGFRPSE
ncbi:MAG: hypothetical protein RLZZ303_742 [Candidatus Hydrogenedentota bacterium]|jgi:DUF4097 and DUF4098 domain-containing protein YvlB